MWRPIAEARGIEPISPVGHRNVVQPPRTSFSLILSILIVCVAGTTTMPPAYNVDIKLSFEQFDMTPGPKGRQFRRNLLLHGGKSDADGFSLADCLLRTDSFAVQRGQAVTLPPPAGVLAAPGAVPAPAGGAPLQTAYRLLRALLKESFRYIAQMTLA